MCSIPSLRHSIIVLHVLELPEPGLDTQEPEPRFFVKFIEVAYPAILSLVLDIRSNLAMPFSVRGSHQANRGDRNRLARIKDANDLLAAVVEDIDIACVLQIFLAISHVVREGAILQFLARKEALFRANV